MRSLRVVATLAVVVGACGPVDGDPRGVALGELAAPSPATAPLVRWWWPGGDVVEAELVRELDHIASLGFGGVEIQAFDAALDPSLPEPSLDRRADVRSERFDGLVGAAVARAEELGITVETTIGSGWPVGGTEVGAEQASTTLMWWERTVTGPMTLDVEPVPTPTVFFTVARIAEASFGERLGRFLPELARPVSAWALRLRSGQRNPSPLALDDTISLNLDSAVELTERWVDGRIAWEVPAGRWHVVAVFAGPAGDYQTLTAERGDPFVVDHLDADAVRQTVDGWFARPSAWGPAWTGIFNDSLEFKVDRLFTDDFAEEFESRRGYALDVRILAALTQSADSFLLDAGRVAVAPEFELDQHDPAIRWDYRQTVSELFVERFLGELASWARERGVAFRSQGYGIDVDVIAAAGAADVPEVETLYAGGSRLFLKIGAAGAHLYGRPIVSSEAFSFILRDHMTTPLKVRAVADLQFAAGVNQLVFHGYPYVADGEYGLTGWTPFSSPYGGVSTFGSTFGERWEFADALPELNRYAARSQALLREGSPGADLLVVYPFFGFPTSLALAEDHLEPLLGGTMPGVEAASREVPFSELAALIGPPSDDERVRWLVAIGAVLDAAESCGLTWDWINPARLAALDVDEHGRLRVGEATYGGLLVADIDAMQVGPSRAVAELAASGAEVVLAGRRPARSPSYAERFAGESVVGAFREAASHALVVDDLANATDALRTVSRRASTGCGGVQRALWRIGDADRLELAFVANPTPAESVQDWSVSGCADAVAYDAWSHEWRPFDGRLSIPAYSSVFVVCDPDLRGVPRSAAVGPVEYVDVSGWSLVAESVADPSARVEIGGPALGDWRDRDALRGLSGRGVYRAEVEFPAGVIGIDLGEVHGVASVAVDGRAAGTAVTTPWLVPLEGVDAGARTVTIEVTPPLRNELIRLGEAGDPTAAQFVGKSGTEVASGLVGPVRLVVRPR